MPWYSTLNITVGDDLIEKVKRSGSEVGAVTVRRYLAANDGSDLHIYIATNGKYAWTVQGVPVKYYCGTTLTRDSDVECRKRAEEALRVAVAWAEWMPAQEDWSNRGGVVAALAMSLDYRQQLQEHQEIAQRFMDPVSDQHQAG